ncbi:MAG: hypothetical protein KF761_05095 [Salinibacterium sp.]|nr:hypothetical protein [Salinibacterium sp.]
MTPTIQRLTFIRFACLLVTIGLFVAAGFIDSARWVLVGAGVVGIVAWLGLLLATTALRM